mmetsp:Transcript_60390/g.95721  ORF Transcript_60390/g.95721 Transcript_60390/m.95721 type:complete len:301 (+) Transcript_60390:448-1350(+)
MGEASQSFQQAFALARHTQLRDALFGLLQLLTQFFVLLLEVDHVSDLLLWIHMAHDLRLFLTGPIQAHLGHGQGFLQALILCTHHFPFTLELLEGGEELQILLVQLLHLSFQATYILLLSLHPIFISLKAQGLGAPMLQVLFRLPQLRFRALLGVLRHVGVDLGEPQFLEVSLHLFLLHHHIGNLRASCSQLLLQILRLGAAAFHCPQLRLTALRLIFSHSQGLLQLLHGQVALFLLLPETCKVIACSCEPLLRFPKLGFQFRNLFLAQAPKIMAGGRQPCLRFLQLFLQLRDLVLGLAQ